MLELRKIDWRSNPAKLKDDIDFNFRSVSSAFNQLMELKASSLTLDSISANEYLSGTTSLTDLFMRKDKHLDITRVSAGRNIVTGGTDSRPEIHVSSNPTFDNIYSGDTDISSIFYTRKEASNLIRPHAGKNISYVLIDGHLSIGVNPHVDFASMNVGALSSDTATFRSINYNGVELHDLFPTHKMSDGIPYLSLRKVDWGRNPAAMRDDVDSNFRSIAHAFSALLEHKLDNVMMGTVNAEHILSGSTPLHDIFLCKNDKHDVVRISCGENIQTGGTQNRPTIAVVPSPTFKSVSANSGLFDSLSLGGKPLSDIYYTRSEASGLTHPQLGNNLTGKSGTIHVVDTPRFASVGTLSLTAHSATFGEVLFRGYPLESLFGSHTFVQPGKNMVTGGTPYAPIVSTSEDPQFNSIDSSIGSIKELSTTSLTASTVIAEQILGEALRVGNMLTVDGSGASLSDQFHLYNGCMTVGASPEREVSSFLRTKMRLVASDSTAIHHALVIQNRNHVGKRLLNDQSVDFVVRGDGRVGIGAFSELSSKLTIKSEDGHDQLKLATSFTPSGSADSRGEVGNISWDPDFLYVKTPQGWKRSELGGF